MKKYPVILSAFLVFLVGCTNTDDFPDTSAPIQGRKVNVYSKAYHEMCTREYDPELCPERYKP